MSNSFQFQSQYLYVLGSRIPCSLCSKEKSINLDFGQLTLTPLSLFYQCSPRIQTFGHVYLFACTNWNVVCNRYVFPPPLCYYIRVYEEQV